MKDCKLHLVIVSSTYMDTQDADQLKERLNKIHVTKFSTSSTINVTKYENEPNTYIIAFKGIDLIDMDTDAVASNIVSLFLNQLKDSKVSCDMGTTFIDDISDDVDEARAALELHNSMSSEFNLIRKDTTWFNYSTSDMMVNLYELYKNSVITAYVDDESSTNGDTIGPSYDEIMSPEIQPTTDYMMDFVNSREGSKKKKKKKKKKHLDSYGVARAIRAAKSPKKYYKRHGVVVCSKKDAIKKDRRIIKEFLEDFIPGKAGWKKDLRNDLLERWMHTYVITKKQLNRLEKDRKKAINQSATDANVQRTLDFTRKLFSVPVDKWNDPTR